MTYEVAPQWLVNCQGAAAIAIFAGSAVLAILHFTRKALKTKIVGISCIFAFFPTFLGLSAGYSSPQHWGVFLTLGIAATVLLVSLFGRQIWRLSPGEWRRIANIREPAVYFDLGMRKLDCALRKLAVRPPLPLTDAERELVLQALAQSAESGKPDANTLIDRRLANDPPEEVDGGRPD